MSETPDTSAQQAEKPFKYFAFISYSRKDSAAAKWLHRQLEWFRFPAALVQKQDRPGHSRYIRPIYRDKTNLEVDHAHYWNNIRRGIEDSRFLVVLCSPHSARSGPVDTEVRHFLGNRVNAQEYLAPVILAGSITDDGNDAALCPALREMGDAITSRNLPTMIPDSGGSQRDAWEDAFIGLVSYLLRINRVAIRDHIRREERRQVLRTRVLAVTFGILAIAAIYAGVMAWQHRRIAREKQMLAETNERMAIEGLKEASRSDTATAQQRLAEEKWQEGVAYLGRAIRYDPENRNAQEALWLALRYGKRDGGRLPRNPNARMRSILSLSQDGTRVIGVDHRKTAQVWDTEFESPIGDPLRHEDSIKVASFSLDGSRVVTASDDKTVRVWDAKMGKPVGVPLRHDKDVSIASLSPDGSRIVTSTTDRTTRVWDADSGLAISEPLRHDSDVVFAIFSPEGSRLAIATWDHTVQVWDEKLGKSIGSKMRHGSAVYCVSFSPDGSQLVTASLDRTAQVWDAETGKPFGQPLRHADAVFSARFSSDGSRIVTAGADKVARVWDARAGRSIGEPFRHDVKVWSASFSPDGSRIVTAGWDEITRVWDAKTGRSIGIPLRHDSGVLNANFSPDGSRLVTASTDKTLRLWDARTGKPVGEPLRHPDEITIASFSPDGFRLLAASADKTIRIWDAGTGRPIGIPIRVDEKVSNASFSSDGESVITTSEDNAVRTWDAATGQLIGEPLVVKDRIVRKSLSPDGSRVLTQAYNEPARILDTKTGQPIGEPICHSENADSAYFSPDSTRVLTSRYDGPARICNGTTGRPISELHHHHGPLFGASFSPDGTRVVTATMHSTAPVSVWDATTGQPIGVLQGDDIVADSASFSPDGLRVVTANADRTARVWDVKPSQPLTAAIAELLTAYCAGARLDSQNGSLQLLPIAERMALREQLTPSLSTAEEWAFVIAQCSPQDPQDALVSPRMTMTLRGVTTRLLETELPANIHDVQDIDPRHPLLPFFHALEQASPTRSEYGNANPIRVAWLCDYGLKHLLADTTPADLRLAAKFAAKASKFIPEQTKIAVLLLDRAANLAPEDEDTKALREQLK